MCAIADKIGRVGTYEARAVGPEATDELFPGCAGVREDDDAADELPSRLNLLLADAAGLVGAEGYAVDVLKRLTRVHPNKLANVTPNESR